MVELELPMHIFRNTWYETSVSVERGPITFALKIGETITKVKNDKDPKGHGDYYYEVRAASPWNYGLPVIAENKVAESYTLEKKAAVSNYPWNLENAPLLIKLKAKQIPSWQLYNEMTGPIPDSNISQIETAEERQIILVPYGCTNLRIAQFPTVY